MSDYISRQAAKDCTEYSRLTSAGIAPDRYADGWNDACVYIRDKLEEENPADVEPVRHGLWKRYSTTMMECSLCGKHTARHKFNYCPSCGAKMCLEEDTYEM